MHTLIFAIDTNRLGISRLPKVLQAAGFKVGTLCSPKSVLTKTRYIDRRYALTSLKSGDYLLKSLIKAIRDWHPEILIPGDEIAVAFLHSVVRRAASQPDTVPKEVLKVVCNSLGSPEYFAATLFKHVTQQLAAEMGIRTPVQQTIASTEAALDFARRQGYPVVLKSDFSWSGAGVKVCRDERQLVEALPALLPPKTHPLKSVVRRWLQRDWYPTGFALGAQQFIQGRPAMYCLVAVAGEVLAGFAAIPEQTMSSTGQSSVVRLVNHREMAVAASKLIQQFDYTGFAGFDFMLDADGEAYFLECNPRPIPVCHLGGLVDTDLCAALFTKMSGKACIPSPVLEETLVTFFPQEWHRDPASHHLLSAHHDVPWDDPELLKACIEWQR